MCTTTKQLEQGVDGAKALGWPAFHQSTVHASPLLYDWDLDGTPDVLVTTYNGEVLAFKDTVGRGLSGREGSLGGCCWVVAAGVGVGERAAAATEALQWKTCCRL